MPRLVFSAFLKLIWFDLCLARRDFSELYKTVQHYPLGKPYVSHRADVICHAVDIACVLYWKRVPCLQRSAVVACLLKGAGIGARLVIGARQLPFRSHAWVEIDGRVVTDKSDMRDRYQVLVEC